MHDQTTVVVKRASSSASQGSGFVGLDTESQRKSSRNLAVVALVYASVYAVAFSTGWLLHISETGQFHWPDRGTGLTALASIGLSIVIVRRCWTCRAAPQTFMRMAEFYAMVAALGISMTYWGWEHEVLTMEAQPFVEVPWVGVWILVFPTFVTLDPGRIHRVSILSALTLPAVTLTSLFVNGIPEGAVESAGTRALWMVAELTTPALICAGIAFFTANYLFRLAQDVTKARRMGSYKLVEKLGVGGMGEVWRAEHRFLTRPAAIKLIRNQTPGDHRDDSEARTARQRFEREAKSTALLTSPHTVELYDFGVTDEGTFYYVMEFLEGLDLKTLVERVGPVPGERAVHFMRQACHSLADAHRCGMVHRDVKPANLYVCRRGLEYDFVKVLDFGLVKETRASGEAQLTVEGIASGTPGFMAPEMVSSSGTIDGRADIYALGCVGYWLLTGALVFEGATAMETIILHAKEPPIPPSARSEEVIDAELEQIVLACLAKDPGDRPQSAQELSARLAEIERRVGAWSQERAERWWRVHMPQHVVAPAYAAGRAASPIATS